MSVVSALKQTIEALPGDQFTQAWKCIEEIDAALGKGGPTALLALNYTRAVHEERVAQMVVMQQTRIGALTTQLRAACKREDDVIQDRGAEITRLVKENKKLAKKKSKK
jgi:hypothetical protein